MLIFKFDMELVEKKIFPLINLSTLGDFLKSLKQQLNLTSLLKVSAIGFVGVSIIYFGKIAYSYTIFKRLGLKTPKFTFFFGNLSEILQDSHSNVLRKWTQLYGKTYGYFEGHLPVIVTSDCDLIQEVFIKQFSSFIARKEYPFQFADDSPKMDLFLSTNKRWKRMRNIINPTFSPAKIKELFPLMKKCADRFIVVLGDNLDKELVISDYLNRYTMDTIWNCAVGMDIDCQNNPDNVYLSKALLVFKDLEDFKLLFRVTTYLSELRPVILGVALFFTYLFGKLTAHEKFVDPLFWLTEHIEKIINDRKNKNIKKRDFIQLLIESKLDESYELKKEERIYFEKFRLDKRMSYDEVKFNLVGFLLAGFETTSTALNYCFYILANHQDEMVKLQEEIDQFYGPDSEIEPDIDNINRLDYLDMFIKEALRMYPISSNTVNRRCMYPTKIKDLDLPAGVAVTVDVLSLHYDPEYWGPVDPDMFYPPRFAPEIKRNQAAYLPWGIGPRNCVGMRFATLEMKLILAKILLRYNVRPTENTCSTLTFIEGTVRRPRNKIVVLFEKRV